MLFIANLQVAAANSPLRGTKENDSEKYAEGVKCSPMDPLPSQSRTILVPTSRINDNYCDCLNGEDEPGTSACNSGKFWCVNDGFRGQYVHHSWVDDGHCDCCDGSDEAPGVCRNSCIAEGQRARREAQLTATTIMRGVAKRQGYAEEGKLAKELDLERLNQVKKEIREMEPKLQLSRARASELETLRDHQKRLRSVATDSVESQSGPHNNDVEERDLEAVDKNIPLVDDITNSATGSEGSEIQKAEGAADTLQVEDTASAVREANPWSAEGSVADAEMRDDHNANDSQDHDDPGRNVVGSGKSLQDIELFCAELSSNGRGTLFRNAQYFVALAYFRVRRTLPHFGWNCLRQSHVESCLQRARVARNELVDKKHALEKEVSDIEKRLSFDYGHDEAFRKLEGTCLRQPLGQYEYEICHFDKVVQYEHGSVVATLGRWSGWHNAGNQAMIFKDGDHCWNGPSRSVTVSLTCGEAEKIITVDEPSRCVYRMTLSTPTSCSKKQADELLAEYSYATEEPRLQATAGLKDEL